MIDRILNKLQLKHKLIILNLFITLIVVLFAAVIIFETAIISFKKSLLHDLTTLEKIVAANSTAFLAFNDHKEAMETLAVLKTSPNIECAIIYSRDGKIFATFWRPDIKVTPPLPLPRDGHLYTRHELSLVNGIFLDGKRIGTIYIRSDLKRLHSLMIQHGVVTIFTLLLAFAIAYVLMSKWQRVILEPIMHLYQVMKLVSWQKNYTVKAQVNGEDEISSLAQGFNAMLEQIQQRDSMLMTEIAERREAEERLRQANEEWDRTFDAIVDPVMIADTNYRIVKANKAMAAKLGVSPAEAKGLTCYTAMHGGGAVPLFCPHSEMLLDGKAHSVEIHEERLGGYFIISVSPLFTPHGEIYGSVHYARDINERKLAEESVRRLNEELEQKVERRTMQLMEAREELLRKEKLAILGQLSGCVGHELRNPLGVMNNAVYFLQNVVPETEETIREYLDMIKHEIDNSQRIISDLLDFSRTKIPETKMVAVRDLVGESLGRCEIPACVELRTDLPDTLPCVKVDPHQMGQVLQNLIVNAVQAMPGGGALEISARPLNNGEEERAERIEITIEDTGDGISSENMKKLFQPLFTTKKRGIGLGLTVCKNLTEVNGGVIRAESEEGKGTRFTILLPTEG